MTPPTLLAIDDHDLFRAGIELIIRQNFPWVEVTTASGLGSAIDAAANRPDVVLLDFNLNGVSGEPALALVRAHWPEAAVIVVTSEQDSGTLKKICEYPAVHVLSKAEPPQALLSLVRAILPDPHNAEEGNAAAPAPALSPRQVEVLRYLREGHSNKAIARLIGLSEFTVRGHVQQILKLIGATNRTNAVFLAEQSGLL